MNSNYICTIILGFRFKSYFHNTKISILISEVKLVSLMIDYSNCLQPCIPKIMNFSYIIILMAVVRPIAMAMHDFLFLYL